MSSEHEHLTRIVELAGALDEDLEVTPFSIQGRIDQTLKQIEWLHELQEHTLNCLEESYATLGGLRRVLSMGDADDVA